MTILRKKVTKDINEQVVHGENVKLCLIKSTHGDLDGVGLTCITDGEDFDNIFKNVSTGIDFVASPAHHLALLIHPSQAPQSGYTLLVDRRWKTPRVFSRPSLAAKR